MSLKIHTMKKDANVFVVSLLGSLDSNTYSELEQALKPILAKPNNSLALDLENLDYISSMGVSVILAAKKNIETRGGVFLMTKLQPQIKTVFEIIKALPSVPVFESIEEADRYLAEMQKRTLEGKK
jgi:anti-anti-sigma factor